MRCICKFHVRRDPYLEFGKSLKRVERLYNYQHTGRIAVGAVQYSALPLKT